jgi:two-component system sensor histidine kinase UhpB
MVFQETELVPTLTVAQNVFLNCEPRNRFGLINDRCINRDARALLDDFGLGVEPEAAASQLGMGQRQQIEIIKALAQRPRVLLLDEPTSALSAAEIQRLFSLLGRLRSSGVAIVYVSHRMEEILRIADRATVLRNGKRVVTVPVSDLTLETLMGYILGEAASRPSALEESEQRFRHLADNIREVFWMVDPRAQRVLYVSPAFEQVWGRSLDTVYADPRVAQESIHEQDRPRVLAANHAEGEPPLEVEYRIVRPDGSIRWIRDRGFPIRDEGGQLYRVVRITEDITERKRVEEELQQSLEQSRAFAARLQNIREEERTRVAREIHDELGQALTAIKIELSSWIRELTAKTGQSVPDATGIMRLIDATIQSVRRISTDLRPGILDSLGLVAALEWATEEFAARTGTACRLELPSSDISVDRERATALFRIFQEALTNVARHANATGLHVRLTNCDDGVCLNVRDNGTGLDMAQVGKYGSLGILGMKERALMFGGEFTVSGVPGQGTSVTARIPKG